MKKFKFLSLIFLFIFSESKAEITSYEYSVPTAFYLNVETQYTDHVKVGSMVTYKGSGFVFSIKNTLGTFLLAPSHLILGFHTKLRVSETQEILRIKSYVCRSNLDLCLVQINTPAQVQLPILDLKVGTFKMKSSFSYNIEMDPMEEPNLGGLYQAISLIDATFKGKTSDFRKSYLVAPKSKDVSTVLGRDRYLSYFGELYDSIRSVTNLVGYGPGWSGSAIVAIHQKSNTEVEFNLENILTTYNVLTRTAVGPNRNQLLDFVNQNLFHRVSSSTVTWELHAGRLVSYSLVNPDDLIFVRDVKSVTDIPIGNGVAADGKPVVDFNVEMPTAN